MGILPWCCSDNAFPLDQPGVEVDPVETQHILSLSFIIHSCLSLISTRKFRPRVTSRHTVTHRPRVFVTVPDWNTNSRILGGVLNELTFLETGKTKRKDSMQKKFSPCLERVDCLAVGIEKAAAAAAVMVQRFCVNTLGVYLL